MYAFWQILVYGILAAAVIALVGVGFALSYMVSGFFNFTLAAFVSVGAYTTFFLVRSGLSLTAAVIGSLVFCMCLASIIEVVILRPLRQRDSSPLVFFLVTLGLYVALQNVISICFGDTVKLLRGGVVVPGYLIAGVRITAVQVGTTITGILLLLTVALGLRLSRLGLSLRTVGDDPFLADVCGIDHDRVHLITNVGTSTLAGFAGISMGLDVGIVPSMGLNALMLGIIAAIIGGVGSISGLALGSLLLATARNLGIWRIGSQWQDAITFAILLLFLLFKPSGFRGKRPMSTIE